MLNSIITVTGGTGSFGTAFIKNILGENISEVRVFSRDEKKQDELRNTIKDKRLKFILGDIRESKSVDLAISGADYVFHAAALKQVPSCEFFPMEAVATNILGSANVLESSIKNKVQSVVCLSTDKSVYPINAMGMTKALMEKTAQSYVRNFPSSETRILITRYGNVMMSNGSVIPLFLNQILNNECITITNPNMTRFLMSLNDSVDLVKYALLSGKSGDIFVKKSPACSVLDLAYAVLKALGVENKIKIETIGTRHGEKLFESLLSAEEIKFSNDLGEFYQLPLDTRSLDYQIFFDKGRVDTSNLEPYTSHNTTRLSVDEIVKLLSELPEFQQFTFRH